MHPLALAASADNAGFAQVGEVAGDFWLALAEDLDKIADADFAPSHKVEQAQAGGVCQSGKEIIQRDGFGGAGHASIVYGLTNMFVKHIFA